MKRLLTTVLGATVLTLVGLSASAQNPPPPIETPDLGSVSGNQYTNTYFGLTLIIPAGWSIQDAAVKKRINERGKQLVTNDNATKKAEFDRAVDKVLNLLTVSERPIGSPGPLNSVFICAVETRPAGVTTDADYMKAFKNGLHDSLVPITVIRDVYPEEIGGAVFSAIDFKTNYSGVFVNQKYFAHIRKDDVLFFILTYDTPEQLRINTEILRSVVIK